MGRPKKVTAELHSIADANIAIHALLLIEVELEKQTGALDIARAEATAKFEKRINQQKSAIADLTLQLQTWYMANHAELEKDGGKSLRLTFGVVGRRMGRPALKPLNRSWTWASIAVKLRSIYNSRFFLAPKEPEIDREKTRQSLNTEQLRDCGLKVEQDEAFFVETDRSKLGELGAVTLRELLPAFVCLCVFWYIVILGAHVAELLKAGCR